MRNYSPKTFLVPVAVAAVAGLATAICIPGPFLHRLSNGLFVGGVVVLVVSVVRLLRRLGVGDAFLFSHLRMSQVIRRSRRKGVARMGEEEPLDTGQAVDSYYNYLQNKPAVPPWAPLLLLGLLLVGVSLLCAL